MKRSTSRQPTFRVAGTISPPDVMPPPWWGQGWFFFLVLAAATLLAYQPVWHAGFIWDDSALLVDNPLVKQSDGWWRVWCAKVVDYVPATSTTFWLEGRMWGANPLGYHLDNVLLHALAACLLWKVLQRLNIPGARLASAIFALHPVTVESVAWIAERKNTLAMVFYLCAILWFLIFEDTGKQRWYWCSAGAFLLALFSKTAVVPLPVVLLGLAWWRRSRIGWLDVRRTLLFFFLGAAGSILAMWIQRGAVGENFRSAGFAERLADAGCAVWFYLGKALLPLHLSPVYPLWHIDPAKVVSYLPAVAVVAVLAGSWHYRRQWGRPVLAAFGYFLALLLPVVGFVDIAMMRYTLVADHWAYFAIIGPIALLAAALAVALPFPASGKMIARPLSCAVLLLALGTLTWRQCRVYTNVSTVWQATLAAAPKSFLAYSSIGGILFKAGKTDEAIAHYDKALEIAPDFSEAHYDLANIYLQTGRPSQALAHYEEVVRLNPSHVLALNNLAWVLATCPQASIRNGARAIAVARKAINLLQADDPSVRGTLAAAYAETGQFPQAITTVEQALSVARARNDTALVKDLTLQLQCYQKGTAYRDPLQAHNAAGPTR